MKRWLVLMLIIFLALGLFGCGGGGDGGAENDDVSLAGVDSDTNGVRDDVQQYIESLPIDEKGKIFAMSLACDLQKLMLVQDQEEAIQVAQDLSSSIESYIQNGYDSAYIAKIRSKMLNTQDRSEAYIEAMKFLGGQMF